MDTYLTRQSLLLRAKNSSDDVAWGELITSYKRYIYVIIHSKGVNDLYVDDIAQQVLLDLWKNLKSYDSEKSKFRTWIANITHYKIIDYFRKEASHSRKLENLKQIENYAPPEIESLAEEEWKFFISNLAFQNLEEKTHTKTLLCFSMFSEGVTRAEIATSLELNIRAVSKNITRVKMKMFREIQRLQAELDI